jgi:CubicO group peptidase (beta-lactamase class C family)
MIHRPFLIALSASFAAAQTAPCHDLGGLAGVAQDAIAQLSLTGMVLRADQHGQPVYALAFGGHVPGQTMALASASKPLAIAAILSLAEQGIVSLDAPVGTYLPEWSVGPQAAITLRMCLLHTTGLPFSDVAVTATNITTRLSATFLAAVPLQFAPGTAFGYGNASLQVAAAACEVATGLSWTQIFQQRIGGPLGMTATDWFAYGPTMNPRVADGAVSNADDFTRFLEMLRRRGLHQGQRVLAEASVDAMFTDQMSHLPVVYSPHPWGAPLGMGAWLERRDAHGRTTLASMPGLFGFFGWIDVARDTTGVWVCDNFYGFVYPYVRRCWDVQDVALAPLGVTCSGVASPPCAAPPRLHAATWARAGQADFGFAVADAPALAFGALFLRFGASGPGVPFLDLTSYMLGHPYSSATMTTDALGRGALPLPLPALPGVSLTAQGLWLDAGGCGISGLRCSRAVSFDIVP